ncbi:MAG: HAMP domain-containing histidine kinase [Propionibacterium sp.]|nr:HAMP domain-containing histidine kinase [Propionibacterium sp.]
MAKRSGGPIGRLSVQLVASHVLVAVVSLASAGALVALLAPRIFEVLGNAHVPGSAGAGRGTGGGLGVQMAEAVRQSLGWGLLVGVSAAVVLGVIAARWLLGQVDALRRATQRLASGQYRTELPKPRTRELAELVDDLGMMAGRLADTEQRRTRLLGEVGHEMRTPLTVIDAQLEAMIDGVMPANGENLSLIATETRRLRRLANDLSSLSRAEEGAESLDLSLIDLGGVVERVVDRLRPQATDAGIDLQVTQVDQTPVLADADRVAQVVTNLVGNAIRATPEGGRITVHCQPDAGQGVVQVTDTGEGLASDDLERIFERFYRVPGRRSSGSDGGGSGIGLTIARHLAERHGGSLTAASAGKGQGSTFSLRLPLAS